jgi:hypothetical protein
VLSLVIHAALTAALLALDAGAPPAPPAEPPAAPVPSEAAVAGAGAGAETAAVGKEAHAAAQAALSAGNRRFKAGDFAGALAEYQSAKSLYPEGAAKVEFNIAKAEEALGHDDAAAEAFERFLELPPTNLVTALADYREEASAALQRLSAGLGSVRLVCSREGLGVLVDEQARGKTPLPSLVRVRPGPHRVVLQDRNGERVFKEEIAVAAGDTVQVIVELEPTRKPEPLPLPPAPPPVDGPNPEPGIRLGPIAADGAEARPVWKRWWFWTAAGAVLAAGVTTLALTLGSSTEASCPAGVTCMYKTVPVPKP